jgi:hypothetical protein
MSHGDSRPLSAPDAMAQYLQYEAQSHQSTEHDHSAHGQMMESVRETTYGSHHIVIRTTYQMEIDDKPVVGHMLVSNDGRVQYHGLPNYSFVSAVDLAKQLIDAYPDDFPPPTPTRRRRGATKPSTRGHHHGEEV